MKKTIEKNSTNRINKKTLLLLASIILTVGVFASCIKEENSDDKNNSVGLSSSKLTDKTQPTTDVSNYQTSSSKTPLSQSVLTTPTKFTQTQAEDIALKHAGIARADVTYIRTEKDYERSYNEYDIEFRVGNYEFSYEINADTGSIISSEKELEMSYVPQTTQITTTQSIQITQPAQTTTSPVNTSHTKLTQTQAEDIALSHVGIARADVTYIHTEKDYEHGYTEYDIEFRVGNYEYSYEINADTGSIISSEKEYEDEYDFD